MFRRRMLCGALIWLAYATLTEGTYCDNCGTGTTYVETISYDDDIEDYVRTISGNGCPNHYSVCTGKALDSTCGAPEIGEEGTSTQAEETDFEWTIPAYPVLRSDDPSDLEYDLGAIGVALNGVAIFGGAVGADELLDVDTDCTQKVDCGEWTSFDMCSGHTSGLGVYHYHFPPTCLLTQAEAENPSTGAVYGHSPQIGWSFDGFPVYGPLYVDGDYVSTLDILDDCSGIEENLPALDKFKYRYYLTGNTSDLYSLPSYPMPEESDYPYTFKCYVGCTYDELEDGSCTGTNGYFSGGTNKYTPTALSGYTDSFADYATDTDGLVNYLGANYTSAFITSDGTCEDTS